MKSIVFIGLLVGFPLRLLAQDENNIWTFNEGGGTCGKVISFNSTTPNVQLIPGNNWVAQFGAYVCAPNGQPRFIVRLSNNSPSLPPVNNILRPDFTPIAGTDLLTGYLDESCMPVVVPHPGSQDQYYIFYAYSKALMYSLLDLSLNSGQGGIVAGQKNIPITPYGSVISQKMTAVKGCGGVWVVVRSRIANQYYSFLVDAAGIDTTAVISNAGLFPAYNPSQGYLKASPDGSRLALSGYWGVELYDFERCSGRITDVGVIASTTNTLPFTQTMFNYEHYEGLCFSLDNSKLYTTYNQSRPAITGFGADTGRLYQFNVALPSLTAIIGSKTLVLSNLRSIIGDISACIANGPNPLGEIKAGPNGKLYIDNGSYTCREPANVPAGFNPGPAFHVINQPNNSGASCNPALNAIIASLPNNYGGDFYKGGQGGMSWLQRDIVVAGPPPDTMAGMTYETSVCFKAQDTLMASEGGSCYSWENGSSRRSRVVTASGTYYVRYFKDCSFYTDTFKVDFNRLPTVAVAAGCPGMHTGRAIAQMDTSDAALYTWKTQDGSILKGNATAKATDTLAGLAPGNYTLEISANGCDTMIDFEIASLPVPSITAAPTDTTIRYGDSITLHANGGLLYVWWPTAALDSATKQHPVATPLRPTVFTVMGMNDYGCRDSALVRIDIDYSMPDLLPNAFSPNGDGLNDVFRLEGPTYQKISRFSVYNRFGQLVFDAYSDAGWDGTLSGKPCDAGVYYYMVTIEHPDGTQNQKKGDVTLIR